MNFYLHKNKPSNKYLTIPLPYIDNAELSSLNICIIFLVYFWFYSLSNGNHILRSATNSLCPKFIQTDRMTQRHMWQWKQQKKRKLHCPFIKISPAWLNVHYSKLNLKRRTQLFFIKRNLFSLINLWKKELKRKYKKRNFVGHFSTETVVTKINSLKHWGRLCTFQSIPQPIFGVLKERKLWLISKHFQYLIKMDKFCENERKYFS